MSSNGIRGFHAFIDEELHDAHVEEWLLQAASPGSYRASVLRLGRL